MGWKLLQTKGRLVIQSNPKVPKQVPGLLEIPAAQEIPMVQPILAVQELLVPQEAPAVLVMPVGQKILEVPETLAIPAVRMILETLEAPVIRAIQHRQNQPGKPVP